MNRVARAMPVAGGKFYFFRRDQAFDRSYMFEKFGVLTDPADFGPHESLCNHQHILFPPGVESSALLSPVQIPVPDARDVNRRGNLALTHF